ncbi:hypothetical protein KVR01_002662 [Diaporthe batatas]|uniref:uncharacterized protein n=1 Tax=Diaporthe batatas TaxID=748121 RepID=UPI001D040FA4|nr:uncharacterized protein KVR01_002662 [Diaporthe batatas]KAG8166973.1 hypothetical protein KVR01_002662 [Diaporthe batatas]
MDPPPQAECLVAAGLSDQLLFPTDSEYVTRNESYFDNGSKLRPTCIVQPRTGADVATALNALSNAGQAFAVRAGGYTNRVGSNNIDGGITIDLGLLAFVDYNHETETAFLGPGAKWQNVYDELENHGRFIGGARVGNLGVGGFLLGGGLSYYSGHCGFACDQIAGYDVALSNGKIIHANKQENGDLFQALKGGSNSFGIVTRFAIKTYPIRGPLWGGVALRPADIVPQASEALESFTAKVVDDLASSVIFVAIYKPDLGGDGFLTMCFNTAGVEKPKAFDDFMSLPETFSSYKTGKLQDMLPFSELPLGYYNIWYTLTFKNDASIVAKASELLYQLARDLQGHIPSNEFNTHCAFQPIPRLYTERSLESGGNILGLDAYPHDAILLQASASVKTAELAEWVRPRVEGLVSAVRDFAGDDRLCPWIYLNYAHSSQEVFESYGPENVSRIRDVAKKYDPEGVFQRLCPGGFKVEFVDSQ